MSDRRTFYSDLRQNSIRVLAMCAWLLAAALFLALLAGPSPAKEAEQAGRQGLGNRSAKWREGHARRDAGSKEVGRTPVAPVVAVCGASKGVQ
jgi:hypothetical protein